MSDLIDQTKNIGFIVLGAIILGIHVVIFRMSQYMFTVIMCIYIIAYSILVIVLMYKNKRAYDSSDFTILLNMSVYTIFLEVFLVLLSIGYMMFSRNRY